ncbi:hypothetical protein PAECIP111893_02504 [Paenibacillus plantiphilus]|uniref:Bacterial toxin 44 domain-containing protein n=1 Tax=Paenibacillus plantiphilus TaxID=2905650 RepID=A0ABN8GI43_9BACL|nr:polymorphic toxin type 44 domain-containing protein [Paenibacillus plantiphilus]CAH1206288.1 hypothetical protein PAECIP111893_02504 [Paenibacillus plantiphilus]
MKKVLTAIVSFVLVFSFSVSVAAAAPNVTTSFSKTMKNNAVLMAYYAYWDQEQETYPIGTGLEFASRVKSNGVWDYKQSFGTTTSYVYNGWNTTGENLGNMHYGYVGRACGFGRTMLEFIAGAVQIYSGTAHVGWYTTYFDDPNDQAWIGTGMNLWDWNMLPATSSLARTKITKDDPMFNILSKQEKIEIERKAKANSAKIRAKQKI